MYEVPHNKRRKGLRLAWNGFKLAWTGLGLCCAVLLYVWLIGTQDTQWETDPELALWLYLQSRQQTTIAAGVVALLSLMLLFLTDRVPGRAARAVRVALIIAMVCLGLLFIGFVIIEE
jgi:hypothetical protein